MEEPLINTAEGCIQLGRIKERESICDALGINRHANPILAIETREKLAIAAVNDRNEAIKDIANIVKAWDSNVGRFIESMGSDNPRLKQLESAIENARRM